MSCAKPLVLRLVANCDSQNQ